MAPDQSYQYPSPSYESIQTFYDTDEDWPGPRCGHTLTAVFVNNSHQLILFGGSTTAVANHNSSLPEISLDGVTNSVHSFDVLTRKWTRLNPIGDVPSPRACHAAALYGTLILIQGGIGPSGPSDGDVYMLDMTNNKWIKFLVGGETPSPRYGHVMDIAAQRWLVIFSGNNGNEILDDTWALDTRGPFSWDRLNPSGNQPSGRMYASGSSREDGIFLLCGGIDHSGVTLGDTYGLKMDSDNVWTPVPAVAPSPRYQHTAVFGGSKLHVIGGILNRARLIDGEAVVAVLDTETGEWVDTNQPETSASGANRQNQYQLMRRCHHAAASFGSHLYVHGGIREDVLLDDLLVAETSQSSSPEPEEDNPDNYMLLDDYLMDEPKPLSSEPEASSFIMRSTSEIAMDRLAEAHNLPTIENAFYDSAIEGYVPLQHGAETVGNRGGLVRTASLDQSTQDLHKKVISTLLRPKTWTPPANRDFFLSYLEVKHLCDEVEKMFMNEPTLLQLKVPIKVFGDIHGQYGDLMRLFHEYGHPSVEGDITHIDYLFLGDYVDRGQHSLEIIMLLFALKIEYPKNIHLIRGNHESLAMNRIYGFLTECEERMGESYGFEAWLKINQVFDYLPLAALLEKKVLCVHGGIGRAVTIEEIENIERPAFPDTGSMVLKDILWSDPTMNDTVLGIVDNARGEGVVSFGPDIVKAFLERNGLEMILRAHECVIDGFERFADGRLITVFSATNYCGTAQNAGAILVIGRDMVIYPKLIHPHPPPISSSEEDYTDKAWMQELNIEMPPTPARGESSE
ncbi:unnamed protein product [Arabidopsis thaliana]|uniref:Serine/threonine-protein phosphatase n=1 Tax=Arabidopsis thaliana TaxID=3702 RepID=A0A5S9SDH6_ARATH|nr:unnamed protein product [Arabidopsis thaliana]